MCQDNRYYKGHWKGGVRHGRVRGARELWSIEEVKDWPCFYLNAFARKC